jgi:lysozyme
MTENGIRQLKLDEGFRTKAYKDTVGIWTIGYGYNMEANPQKLSAGVLTSLRDKGITEAYAAELLVKEVNAVEKQLQKYIPTWEALGAPRQDVLINMGYNLGVPGLMKFKQTLALIQLHKYVETSDRMLQSLWARQVGDRAVRLANLMKKGVY